MTAEDRQVLRLFRVRVGDKGASRGVPDDSSLLPPDSSVLPPDFFLLPPDSCLSLFRHFSAGGGDVAHRIHRAEDDAGGVALQHQFELLEARIADPVFWVDGTPPVGV